MTINFENDIFLFTPSCWVKFPIFTGSLHTLISTRSSDSVLNSTLNGCHHHAGLVVIYLCSPLGRDLWCLLISTLLLTMLNKVDLKVLISPCWKALESMISRFCMIENLGYLRELSKSEQQILSYSMISNTMSAILMTSSSRVPI